MIIIIIMTECYLVIDELSEPGHVAEKPCKSGYDDNTMTIVDNNNYNVDDDDNIFGDDDNVKI